MSLPLPPGSRIHVSLEERGHGLDLCALGRSPRGQTALEWTADALVGNRDAGANLAVRQAPLLPGVHLVGKRRPDGLPGFLADSLPDSWGRLLVDRQLRKRGVTPGRVTGFDRLAIVGARGPGALSYAPEYPLGPPASGPLDLDSIAADATLVLSGSEPELLARLERLGGSAGGSRPKAWIAEGPDGTLRSGVHRLAADEIGWLVKFRAPNHDPEDIAALEYAYAQMARSAGLDVAEPRLFETDKGHYFGSRRFDRVGEKRIHVLTAAAVLDVDPEQALATDYIDLLKLTRHVTRSEQEVTSAFRHAVFNVFANNRDDHLKQFAFLHSDGWKRTPAYDLTFSPGPGGEHTLLVAGEGRRPNRTHLLQVAESANLKKASAVRVMAEVREVVLRWVDFAAAAGVGETTTALVAEAIRENTTPDP